MEQAKESDAMANGELRMIEESLLREIENAYYEIAMELIPFVSPAPVC